MSNTGKTSTYIRKSSVKESTTPNTGFKKTRFLHEASEGDTLIQLSSLTAPASAVNYSAPNVSELTQTNLMQWAQNVTLTSSLRGLLIQNLAYVISGASTIKLLFEAEEGEVFEGVIDHNARTGLTMVDAAPLIVSGTLLAGETDFNVGVPYKVGAYPSAKRGVVMVEVDGQPVYRTDGNAAFGVGISGDYYEVHSGNGLGQIVRFQPDLVNDRFIMITSVGALVERPNGSIMAVMESLQGQIDAMVPTLAELAEVSETNFQSAPNNSDLKTFGDRVITLEGILDVEVPIVEGVQTYIPSIASTGTAPTKGATTHDIARYWRNGEYLEWEYDFFQTGATGANGTGVYKIPIPGGLTIDTTHYPVQSPGSVERTINSSGHMGDATNLQNQTYRALLFVSSSTELSVLLTDGASTTTVTWQAGTTNATFASDAIRFSLKGRVKILGWNATQTIREALGL